MLDQFLYRSICLCGMSALNYNSEGKFSPVPVERSYGSQGIAEPQKLNKAAPEGNWLFDCIKSKNKRYIGYGIHGKVCEEELPEPKSHLTHLLKSRRDSGYDTTRSPLKNQKSRIGLFSKVENETIVQYYFRDSTLPNVGDNCRVQEVRRWYPISSYLQAFHSKTTASSRVRYGRYRAISSVQQ